MWFYNFPKFTNLNLSIYLSRPNSYRIFCEEISNDSMHGENKYQSQAPPIYTHPMIIPAQAIEDRNHPHAGRQATFLRENARTLNEPVAKVMSSKNKGVEAEKRWWEWDTVANGSKSGNDRRIGGKRSQSNAPPSSSSSSSEAPMSGGEFASGSSGFQQQHPQFNGHQSAGATRHGSNPNSREAIGIVPVNDLIAYSKSGEEQQRVYVDKMSFDHQYDSRKDNNYPNVGKVRSLIIKKK